ncbi:MAG: N-acetylmuramidase [Candidatus Marinimicrobia bacterium]|nr:N-acetylmuramidase [Candidatus Neomarinimicrobiota bacterium]
MADFSTAFEKMIQHEGGFILENVEHDLGGLTYAGITKKYHPDWQGWQIIDLGETDNPNLTQMVKDHYRSTFWTQCKGKDINNQKIAETIFDFSVNAGFGTAAKLAQIVVGATPDGIIGPRTLEKLNVCDEESFIIKYTLAKIARYAEICRKNPVQKKFLLGWINRALGDLS